MNFLDIENYENLMKIYKLNKDIYILKLEINEFEDKKKSNLYFLNIQQEVYNTTIMKKKTIIKKYKFQIIKNILNMHLLQKMHMGVMAIHPFRFTQKDDWRLSYAINGFTLIKKKHKIIVKQYIVFDKTGKVYTDLNLGVAKLRVDDGFVHTFDCTPFWVYSEFSR